LHDVLAVFISSLSFFKADFAGPIREKHLDPCTIRVHLMKTGKQAGLDHKYGRTNDGHVLSVLCYHALGHYFLQKTCDQRGVFAAQITGRHKTFRSTERYLTTSMVARRDIVNEVFNVKEVAASYEVSQLKDELARLKALVKQSVTICNGNLQDVKNQRRIALGEAEKAMQNRALVASRHIR